MDTYRICRICHTNTEEYISCLCHEIYCITHQSEDLNNLPNVQGCCTTLLHQLQGVEEITIEIKNLLSPILQTVFHCIGLKLQQNQVEQQKRQHAQQVEQSSQSSSSNQAESDHDQNSSNDNEQSDTESVKEVQL